MDGCMKTACRCLGKTKYYSTPLIKTLSRVILFSNDVKYV